MSTLTTRERMIGGGFHDHMADIDMLNILEDGRWEPLSLAAAEAARRCSYGAYGVIDWTPIEVLNAVQWAWTERHKP